MMSYQGYRAILSHPVPGRQTRADARRVVEFGDVARRWHIQRNALVAVPKPINTRPGASELCVACELAQAGILGR